MAGEGVRNSLRRADKKKGIVKILDPNARHNAATRTFFSFGLHDLLKFLYCCMNFPEVRFAKEFFQFIIAWSRWEGRTVGYLRRDVRATL
jgi:hypothetical protein